MLKGIWAIVSEELMALDGRLKAKACLLMGSEAIKDLTRWCNESGIEQDPDIEEMAPDGLVNFFGFPVVVDYRISPRAFAIIPSEAVADQEKLTKWLQAHGAMTMDDERWYAKVSRT